jgi:hypothetical protein
MAEGLGGPLQKAARGLGLPQRVCGNHPHPTGLHVTEALTKTSESGQGPGLARIGQPVSGVEPRGEPDRFAQSVDDRELAMGEPGHHHVEAVRAKINGCKNVLRGLRCAPAGINH